MFLPRQGARPYHLFLLIARYMIIDTTAIAAIAATRYVSMFGLTVDVGGTLVVAGGIVLGTVVGAVGDTVVVLVGLTVVVGTVDVTGLVLL